MLFLGVLNEHNWTKTKINANLFDNTKRLVSKHVDGEHATAETCYINKQKQN